jgi:hypothetical protein
VIIFVAGSRILTFQAVKTSITVAMTVKSHERPYDDPLDALRDEFGTVEKSAEELRAIARDKAVDEAGN